jgi:hypothetical protein
MADLECSVFEGRVENIFETRPIVCDGLYNCKMARKISFRRHIVFLGQDQRSNRPRYRDQDKFGKPDYTHVFLPLYFKEFRSFTSMVTT